MSLSPVQRRIHQAAISLFARRNSVDVNISELAEMAGVARGTIYNNIDSIDTLFEKVASQLSGEMNRRIVQSFLSTTDPAARLANGIRFYIRRAHEEPEWARFIATWGPSNDALKSLWDGLPVKDLMLGIEKKRFDITVDQIPVVTGLLSGSVIMSMLLVLDGISTWREAGTQTAELVLRSLGLSREQAMQYASAELPELPEI